MPSRLTLGIETSGRLTGVALTTADRVLFDGTATTGGHNESLLLLLRRAFAATGCRPTELSLVGVSIGPGMFTSLRVGLAAAKGLALPNGIPLKAVGTLPALAASMTAEDAVLALVDGRKSQVYAAFFRGGTVLLEPVVASPADVPRLLAGCCEGVDVIDVAGSGTGICLGILRAAGLPVRDAGIDSPSPVAVARLAERLLKKSGPDDADGLQPLYLRRTDAELKRTAAGG